MMIVLATTEKTLGRRARKRAPWATSELVRLADEKSHSYKLMRRYPENIEYKNAFKEASKKVKIRQQIDK